MVGFVVGFVGLIGSGKGTAGDILVQKHDYKAESFAKPVKDACAPIFGWDRKLLEGDTKESREFRETPDPYWTKVFGRPYTPREALQKMGTEAGRNVFHTNLWTASLAKRLLPRAEYVVTDVRFPNEIKAIKNLRGMVIHVKRGADPTWMKTALHVNKSTNWDGSIQVLPAYPDVHYSEWAWVGCDVDHVITNDGTVEELEAKVLAATAPF